MHRPSFALVLLVGCVHAQVTSRDMGESLGWTYAGEVAPENLIRAQAIYTPDPAIEKMTRVRKSTIEGAVRFCVNVMGKTEDLATERATGDAKLDAALRTEVAKWRFKPALFAYKPVQACTTVTFVVTFR